MTSRVLAAAALLLLCACTQVELHADAPATVTSPTARSRADLAKVLRRALGQTPRPLADDALARDSVLVIERVRLADRELDRPERFQLLKSRGLCVLVHERTGRRYTLVHTRCRVL